MQAIDEYKIILLANGFKELGKINNKKIFIYGL